MSKIEPFDCAFLVIIRQSCQLKNKHRSLQQKENSVSC